MLPDGVGLTAQLPGGPGFQRRFCEQQSIRASAGLLSVELEAQHRPCHEERGRRTPGCWGWGGGTQRGSGYRTLRTHTTGSGPAWADGSVSPQNGTGVTSLTTLLGEENKPSEASRSRAADPGTHQQDPEGAGACHSPGFTSPESVSRTGSSFPVPVSPTVNTDARASTSQAAHGSPHGAPWGEGTQG